MRLFPENGARQLILGMHGNALRQGHRRAWQFLADALAPAYVM